MTSHPRVTVLSRRAVESRVWHASQYEFEDVIAEIDDAQLLSPPPASSTPVGTLRRGALNRARRTLGVPRRGRMLRPGVPPEPTELFFAVFAAPHEIADLGAVRPYLDRFDRKVAYVVEFWSSQVPGARDMLRHLRGFDHIFVFNRHVVEALERATGVPCSYLPFATDMLRFGPPQPEPARTADVTLYGRRPPGRTHAALVCAAEQGRVEYEYDTVRGAFDVTDHREHRLALARRLQRSTFSLVYRINDSPSKLALSGGEESLSARHFEAAAAGSVLLGGAPEGPDFPEAFDWEDALVPLAVDAPDVADVVVTLREEPERWRAAGRRAVLGSLERHDWSHRWQQVLDVIGMPASLRGDGRRAGLARRAEQQRALLNV